jgi:hypothetical protein
LRNAIERIFGVLKKRFPILSSHPEYPYPVQVQLVFALTALHNFIRQAAHNADDEFYHTEDDDNERSIMERGHTSNRDDEAEAEVEDEDMSQLRENIAIAMWRDYQALLTRRLSEYN